MWRFWDILRDLTVFFQKRQSHHPRCRAAVLFTAEQETLRWTSLLYLANLANVNTVDRPSQQHDLHQNVTEGTIIYVVDIASSLFIIIITYLLIIIFYLILQLGSMCDRLHHRFGNLVTFVWCSTLHWVHLVLLPQIHSGNWLSRVPWLVDFWVSSFNNFNKW